MYLLLHREPDLLRNIFALLSPCDICNAELACKDWRCFVMEQSVWKIKLLQKWYSNLFWKTILQQHDWSIYESRHEINKRLFMQIAIVIPDQINDANLRLMLKDSPLNDMNVLNAKLKNINPILWGNTQIHRAFLSQLHRDKSKIVSKLPRRPWGRRGWRTGPRKVKLKSEYCFSKIVLYSPSAFPILVNRLNGDVVLAGARYGKGRLIVGSHETLLNNAELMQVEFLLLSYNYIRIM